MPYDKYGNFYLADPSSGMASAAPRTSGMLADPSAAPQDWYDFGFKDQGNSLMLPSFAHSDLMFQPGSAGSMFGTNGDAGPSATTSPTVYLGGGSGRDYGAWSNLGNPNNFETTYDPNDPNKFSVRVKTGDKQGTSVYYNKQGDRWVPQQDTVNQAKWDTSPDVYEQYAPLLMAGGFAAAPAIAGMLGGAGAAGGAGGMAAGEGAMLGGGVAPLTYGGAGGMVGGAGTVAGGVSAAGGEGGMLSGALGGGGSSALDALKSFINPSVLASMAPSAIKALTGLITDRNARQGQTELFNNNAAAAGDYKAAQNGYADSLSGMFAETDPRYKQFRDQYFDAAGNVLGQAKNFDPKTFATERYNAAQGLLAAGDTRDEQGLMQKLYDKGGYGLTLNSPAAATPADGGGVTAGTGSVGINPYVDTFLNARNTRNADMSYKSLNEGENYLDNLLKRGNGMLSSAGTLDSVVTGRGSQVAGARRDATTRYIEAMLKAQNERTGTNTVSAGVRDRNIGSVIENLPGSVWSSLAGLFGGGK